MKLREDLLVAYKDKYLGKRALIYSPVSGNWKYAFLSWQSAMEHMGIKTDIVYGPVYLPFDYDLFIGIADRQWIENRWKSISYKIGIASKEDNFVTTSECTGIDLLNISLIKEFKYNVLIAAASQEWLNLVLKQWIDNGITVKSVPLSFNPLIFYPEECEEEYDFFYAGENTTMKEPDTKKYLTPIANSYGGMVVGNFWGGGIQSIPPKETRYYYNRAKINLNYHGKWQRAFENEVNERTFIISGCGAFQLVDNPKALSKFFTDKELAIAQDEKDYFDKFKYYLNKPEERHEIAYNALLRSYRSNYSLFDRLEGILWKDGTS